MSLPRWLGLLLCKIGLHGERGHFTQWEPRNVGRCARCGGRVHEAHWPGSWHAYGMEPLASRAVMERDGIDPATVDLRCDVLKFCDAMQPVLDRWQERIEAFAASPPPVRGTKSGHAIRAEDYYACCETDADRRRVDEAIERQVRQYAGETLPQDKPAR